MFIKAQARDTTKYFLHNQKNDQTIEFDMTHKLKEQKQIQNAMQAIIEALE